MKKIEEEINEIVDLINPSSKIKGDIKALIISLSKTIWYTACKEQRDLCYFSQEQNYYCKYTKDAKFDSNIIIDLDDTISGQEKEFCLEKLIISKDNANNFDRKLYEKNLHDKLIKKLIIEINMLLQIHYDDIVNASIKNSQFTVFEWKVLDSDFYLLKGNEIRDSVFKEISELYKTQNISVSIMCEQFQKRVSFQF